MPPRRVTFTYSTGLRRRAFKNARLLGSWDAEGRYSDTRTSVPMSEQSGEDGCQQFVATVSFGGSEVGRAFKWGVVVDTDARADVWAIATEVKDRGSQEQMRTFVLGRSGAATPQTECYRLCHHHWLGANKRRQQGRTTDGIQFAVWAPNAQEVELVFGDRACGYIADDGSGASPRFGSLQMTKDELTGVWSTTVVDDYARYDHQPYMFKIRNRGGAVVYRTDLYSRCQIGGGSFDPQGKTYAGPPESLDGTVSCSVVVDPTTVAAKFKETQWPEHAFIPESEFWQDELPAGVELARRLEDLVIYELHVGSLGYPKPDPGGFADAVAFLDHLVSLGVNAVELMPMSEFNGAVDWGYSTSHYFALEFSAGGRDQLKHFVRACHQRGILVLLDVVYNHYHHRAARAEWAYDADEPEHNIYYWYEGHPADYPGYEEAAAHPAANDPHPPTPGHGGYVDNMSTAYAPRFHEEMVRKMFISSAVALVEDFHIDGFRVDQTTSVHAYNVLHANGQTVGDANIFGAKLLREYCRTLKMVKPDVLLIAEDHSNWDKVTESTTTGGLGFDATWYADFYHHLVGNEDRIGSYACLLYRAGVAGDEAALPIHWFRGAFIASADRKIVYHESHDEAGNARHSARTMKEAVGWAPIYDATRRFAEARARFAAGMSLLSPGTPMFFMGEEVASICDFRYDGFKDSREDIPAAAQALGKPMFTFYRDLIRFRLTRRGLRARNNYVEYVSDADRVLAFRRWEDGDEYLVVGSLKNSPYEQGYTLTGIRAADGDWREVFNSDAAIYGGWNVGNLGGRLRCSNGTVRANLPASGFVVLQRESD